MTLNSFFFCFSPYLSDQETHLKSIFFAVNSLSARPHLEIDSPEKKNISTLENSSAAQVLISNYKTSMSTIGRKVNDSNKELEEFGRMGK